MLVDTLVGAMLAAGGWFAKTMHTDLQQTKVDLALHKERVAAAFITKDDYREDIRELKQDIKDVLSTLSQHVMQEDADRHRLIEALGRLGALK
jgi:uncharacterized membrane protein YccC